MGAARGVGVSDSSVARRTDFASRVGRFFITRASRPSYVRPAHQIAHAQREVERT